MGLFFSARSWRAPLQLIDCWLPEPTSSAHDRAGHSPRALDAVPAPPTRPASLAVQRFARAGWLGRPAANAPRLDDPTDPAGAACGAAGPERRAGRSGTAGSRRSGARVVLSGRMDQVCAELERLAAQEEALQRAA